MPLLNLKSKKDIIKYNEFLLSNNAFFTQSIEWGNVKKNWKQYVIYITNSNDEIIMSANFLVQQVPFLKKLLVYSPRGPVGDIKDKDIVSKLIEEVFNVIGRKNIFCIKFDPLIEIDEKLLANYNNGRFRINKHANYNDLIYAKYNMYVDLKLDNIDSVLLSFNQTTRRKIKQASKNNYEIILKNDIETLKRFYNIYTKTNMRKNLSGRNFEYLETMLKSFDKSVIKVCIVSENGIDLAGSILFYYCNRVYYAYGATDIEQNSKNASYFMHWNIIKDAFDNGYTIYDMGVCNTNSINDGVYLFKEGFCRKTGYFEAVGEIDYIVDKFIYTFFIKGVPLVKKIRHILNKFLKK